MIAFWIILGIAVLYLCALTAIVHKFAFMVLKPDVHSYEHQIRESLKLGRFTEEYIASLKTENFETLSRYGYQLKGIIQNNDISILPENRTKVAILCHGYTSGGITMSGYAKRLLDLGFTCVMYDHRNHGFTGPVAYTSMGYYEKFDLQTVIDFCYEKYGNDIRILTYGESMGSAIVLGLLEIDSRPVLTVADCGYSSLKDLCKYLLSEFFKVPAIFPVIPLANRIIARKGHFLVEQVNPIEGVKRAKTPILFCHGKSDTFIPCRMSVEMSKVGPGVRKLYLCESANHAVSEVTNPEEYYRHVLDFIREYY